MATNEQKMRMHNRTLEEILQHFFGSKKPFRKDGEFTKAGSRAYAKLIELVYNVGWLTNQDVNDTVDTLDLITHENY